jgi:DNA-directed RNA polymerase subunit M/transcription elongation factor TFIIS
MNNDDIHFCTDCDSEFTVTKIDDDEIEVQFCPFCGYDMAMDDVYDDEDEEDDNKFQ